MSNKVNGTLIVSLDFELFWGMQDCASFESYGKNILGGRKAIPQMLQLFKKYNIHATWATVGYLFADNANDAKKYFPSIQPSYKNTSLSTYNCFNSSANEDKYSDYYYAPELIQLISNVDGQEIASHSFSHYYCREDGQTAEQFKCDMQAAIDIAKAKGYEIKSVVLPRNQTTDECVNVLRELKFSSYRDEENDWIHEKIKVNLIKRVLRLLDVYFPLTGLGGYKPKSENGIVNLVGSRMYKPYFKPLAFLEGMKIHRIKKQMLHAAKNGLTFHLWWHPHNVGVNTEFHMKQLESIFCYYKQLQEKYGMCSLNMMEAADKINH